MYLYIYISTYIYILNSSVEGFARLSASLNLPKVGLTHTAHLWCVVVGGDVLCRVCVTCVDLFTKPLLRGGGRLWPYPFDDHTTVCSLRMMTPPLTLTTAMQIAAAYGGDEL